jgi:predicted nucleic acid-binding Zn ribbon protein
MVVSDGWGQRREDADRRRAKVNDPRRVGAFLADAARSLGAEGAVELAAVKGRWADAVGPQVAAHCWPVALEGGVLTVVADHHAWASELRILSAQLLSRVRQASPDVQSIVVRVGPPGGRAW